MPQSIEHTYLNYRSHEVQIGGLTIGGRQPVRIQSMTNTPTTDLQATVDQCLKLWEAGCELIRLAVPALRDAKVLPDIRSALHTAGCEVPLCADIHYLPSVALEAARHVEKIRINPGNYIDKPNRKGSGSPSHAEVMERAHQHLAPLITCCKDHGTVVRIGVNHGSLSDRILLKYGNTPEGMVASAMEFILLCEDFGFRDIVVSMKASSVGTTVRATRLLASTLLDHGVCYPLHLGVTEAGEGSEGRLKSYAGIGTLLGEGLGDTIRVSLTENPLEEIPVAKELVDYYHAIRKAEGVKNQKYSWNPFTFQKRNTIQIEGIGGDHYPVVIATVKPNKDLGNRDNIPVSSVQFPDYLYEERDKGGAFVPLKGTGGNVIPLRLLESKVDKSISDRPHVIFLPEGWNLELIRTKLNKGTILLTTLQDRSYFDDLLEFIEALETLPHRLPLILNMKVKRGSEAEALLHISSCIAPLLIDGLIDGIWLEGLEDNYDLLNWAYGLLQVCGSRVTRAEYISCPSCGRTTFDIQAVLKEVKAATSQLKHLRIGVMGCTVNGPGEMAGADYGYVGAGYGKVNLYKGSSLVVKNIPQDQATTALVALIRINGDWTEP